MPTISSYAATWRDAYGGIVASVYGDTVCLSPIDARNLAAVSADGNYESTLPCRKCEGCRRYQRLVLKRRLAERFKSWPIKLWTLQVVCSPSARNTAIRMLRRMLKPHEWQGYCISRDGLLALIARPDRPFWSVLITGPTKCFPAKPVKVRRGLRAWSKLTAGLLVSREHIGENVNRYYFRELPYLPREAMQIETQGGTRKRHPEARAGFRAWRDGLTLYLPEILRARERISRLHGRHPALAAFNSTRPGREATAPPIEQPGLIPREAFQSKTPVGGRDATSVLIPNDIQALIDRLRAKQRGSGRE